MLLLKFAILLLSFKITNAAAAKPSKPLPESSSFSGYSVPPHVLATMGGIQQNKSRLMLSGAIYLPQVLRGRFIQSGPGWIYFGSLDEYAVCQGQVTGRNATNHSAVFNYFLCPSDLQSKFNYSEIYCCGQAKKQHCCGSAAFGHQYGVLPGDSIMIIIVACVLVSLGTCVCCCVAACCLARMSGDQRKKPKAATAPANPPPPQGAPPLEPAPQDGPPPYPAGQADPVKSA